MLTIRREEPEDAEAIAGVHIRSWQAGYAGIMPDEVLGRLNVRAWAQRRRDFGTADPEHPFATLVAEEDGVITGLATFGPYRNNQDRGDLDPRYGEIIAIYVDPDRWGTGTGRTLLTAAREGLAGRGWTEYRLWVLAENARARRFYERAGLSPDGEESLYRVPLSGGRDPVGLAEVRYTARLDG